MPEVTDSGGMQPMLDRLEAVYRDVVRPRMQGLPVYNAALRVEALVLRQGYIDGFSWSVSVHGTNSRRF